ncbi:MAG: hypothetical protein COB59_11585 [Rhodospirillaceae bacterium]|nr:MAG: hypothetical protein COB59_11585 [Rhodospirillaceae bacterium]
MKEQKITQNPQKLHWLVRPKTIKGLWIGGILLLALVTGLGTTVHPHTKFGIEGTVTFYSWYGFVTCIGMVLFAKFIVGKTLGRKDTYYDN